VTTASKSRDEPRAAASGLRRLRVAVSEPNMSETTVLLKLGATNLVGLRFLSTFAQLCRSNSASVLQPAAWPARCGPRSSTVRVESHLHWLPGRGGDQGQFSWRGRPSGVQAAPSALMNSPMTGNHINMKRYTFVSAPALIS
jgi:hypothetical protein